MRIAIPITDDWIAPVFDNATRLLVVDIEADRKVERCELPSSIRPPAQRAAELASLGIDLLLCNRISDGLTNFLRERGIKIRVSIDCAVNGLIPSLVNEARA